VIFTSCCVAEVSQQQQEQQQPPGGPQQQQPSWRWEDSPDAVWAYGAFFGTLLLGNLPVLQQYKEGGEATASSSSSVST
jgi:hypothetical protein